MNAIVKFPPQSERFELTPAQSVALEAMREFALTPGGGFFTLEGYAGVGKTTVVAELLQTLPEYITVAVAAPTNKAVGVLQSKIGEQFKGRVEFGSLHSFLGLRLLEREDGTTTTRQTGRCRIDDFDLVIVDEASMVGRQLFGEIALRQHSGRTLFVGDPAQLPPVQARGEPRELLSLAFTRVQRKVALTEVVRQERDNPIIALSMRIREAIEAGARPDGQLLAAACPADAMTLGLASGGTSTALTWALYDLRAGRDSRILAYRNATVIALNQRIHAELHGSADLFAPGETAMLNEAYEYAPEKRLVNSEEVRIVAVVQGEHPHWPQIEARRVTIERHGGEQVELWVGNDPAQCATFRSELWSEYAQLKRERDSGASSDRDIAVQVTKASNRAWAFVKAFAPLRHVYAMTVHKSQGSTLQTAIVDVGDIARMRDAGEYARALYVAVTRPRQNLGLVLP